MVISAGMANFDEVDHAISVLKDSGCRDITLLHCVSAYPTPKSDCNLAVIGAFRERYGVKVGWSDHSVSAAVIRRAVGRWQADCVEFHIDLDEQAPNTPQGTAGYPSRCSR